MARNRSNGSEKRRVQSAVTLEGLETTYLHEIQTYIFMVCFHFVFHQALSDVEEGEKIYEELNNSEDNEGETGEIPFSELEDEENISD